MGDLTIKTFCAETDHGMLVVTFCHFIAYSTLSEQITMPKEKPFPPINTFSVHIALYSSYHRLTN